MMFSAQCEPISLTLQHTQPYEAYNFYVDAQPDQLPMGCFTGFFNPGINPVMTGLQNPNPEIPGLGSGLRIANTKREIPTVAVFGSCDVTYLIPLQF